MMTVIGSPISLRSCQQCCSKVSYWGNWRWPDGTSSCAAGNRADCTQFSTCQSCPLKMRHSPARRGLIASDRRKPSLDLPRLALGVLGSGTVSPERANRGNPVVTPAESSQTLEATRSRDYALESFQNSHFGHALATSNVTEGVAEGQGRQLLSKHALLCAKTRSYLGRPSHWGS